MKTYRFRPIIKQTIWGGKKIALLKNLTCPTERIGESWELSGLPGNESICTSNNLRLNTLVAHSKGRFVGVHVYERFGNIFPLLIKFIDADTNLSIQVHPDDHIAQKNGFSYGKTEMWYVLPSASNASLYCGLRQTLSRTQYEQMIRDGSICSALARYHVKEGDVFFIPAGRIHAIGAGCLIAEIQQTCDITYRIYDYGRKDFNGNYRQLHIDEALESTDFSVYDDYRTHYNMQHDYPCKLVKCPYFVASVYDITNSICINQEQMDSFIILIGLSGEIRVDTDEETTILHSYETLLLAAENRKVKIDGIGKIIEVHM